MFIAEYLADRVKTQIEMNGSEANIAFFDNFNISEQMSSILSKIYERYERINEGISNLKPTILKIVLRNVEINNLHFATSIEDEIIPKKYLVEALENISRSKKYKFVNAPNGIANNLGEVAYSIKVLREFSREDLDKNLTLGDMQNLVVRINSNWYLRSKKELGGKINLTDNRFQVLDSDSIKDNLKTFLLYYNSSGEELYTKLTIIYLWIITMQPYCKGNFRLAIALCQRLIRREKVCEIFSIEAQALIVKFQQLISMITGDLEEEQFEQLLPLWSSFCFEIMRKNLTVIDKLKIHHGRFKTH